MTISIAGYCSKTKTFGCVISSSSISVASRCAFVQAKTGVTLTQNITNPALGSLGLALLSEGATATQALEQLKLADEHIEYRQLGVLDTMGNGATFSGQQSLGIFNTSHGFNCIAMGNLLDNVAVPQAMTESFEANSDMELAERLIEALAAGINQGGELGELKSAGLMVCIEHSWPEVDLRVDWDDNPLEKLREAWAVYKPQMKDYMLRADNPSTAASYGVPGDE